MSPFFSIIIPTYNREKYIQETINSVLNQSFPDFELIVIDNQSKDRTTKIIQEIKDDRLFFYQNEQNFERCYSRNRGVSIAKGKYILLLDSDDFFESNHLSNWYNFLHDKVDLIDTFYVSDKQIWSEKATVIHRNPDINEHPVSYFFAYPIIPGQVCIPNKLLKNYLFRDDLLIFEDAAMWMELATEHSVVFNSISTFRYRLHSDNSVNEFIYNVYYKRLIAIKRLLKDNKFVKFLSKNSVRLAFNSCYMGIIRYHEANSSRFVRISWIIRSILFYPEFGMKNKLLLLLKSFPLISFLPYFKHRELY